GPGPRLRRGGGAALLEGTPMRPEDTHAPAATPPRGTVLLVEDEDGVRRMCALTLRACGYAVLEAPDGPAALAVCAGHRGPLCLLLADVLMPRMSGRELAGRLRVRWPGVRVLYVSGYVGSVVLRLETGASEPPRLQKPFGPEELVRKVREVLDAPIAPAS